MTLKQGLSALALGAIMFLSPIAGSGRADADPSRGASDNVSKTPAKSTRAVGATGHFRWQVALQCSNGNCTGNGPTVPSEDWYDVIHNVSCFVSVGNNGQFIDLRVDVQGYLLDLGLQWERKIGNTTRYNFGKAADLWINTGKRLKVSGRYTPTNAVIGDAYCLFTGEFIE